MNDLNGRIGRATMGLLLAGTLMMGSAAIAQSAVAAQPTYGALDSAAASEVSFSATERGKPILAGSDVSVSGRGFKPGQQVSLFYGKTQLDAGKLVADAEGKISGKLTVPAGAQSGTHPIVVVAEGPYHAAVANLKVSPTVPLFGQSAYVLTEGGAAKGLYQSAYSPRSNSLYITSAVGRPPVRQSELVKLNADTLAVTGRATPAPVPATAPVPASAGEPQAPGVFAVYGVGIDDAKGTVWATNTRQDTVAVYRQSDLSLVKQFEPGTVTHARDIVVDQVLGKAYSSATGTPEVVVIDTGSLDVAGRIKIETGSRGKAFSAASLSLDPAAHRLYVVSLSTSEVAVINTRTDAVEKVFPVPGARGSIGVSHDPKTGRIYVASQGSDNLIVLDGTTGAVIADTPVGAGALNVVFDPVKRRAYVSNRGAGTIAVTDADGKLVANLGPAPLANHVSLGKAGTVYAVDKSANARGEDSDAILKISPAK